MKTTRRQLGGIQWQAQAILEQAAVEVKAASAVEDSQRSEMKQAKSTEEADKMRASTATGHREHQKGDTPRQGLDHNTCKGRRSATPRDAGGVRHAGTPTAAGRVAIQKGSSMGPGAKQITDGTLKKEKTGEEEL